MTDIHFKILVPNVAAGAIIGKGGEAIETIKRQTGARLKMSRADDFYPGTTERVCLIVGSIEACMHLHDYVMNKMCERPQTIATITPSSVVYAERHKQVKILVPDSTAGVIIGKRGAFIEKIKKESRAFIQISQRSREIQLLERCIVISGEIEERRKAVGMILQKIIEDPNSANFPNCSYSQLCEPVASAFPSGSPFALNFHSFKLNEHNFNFNTNVSTSFPSVSVDNGGVSTNMLRNFSKEHVNSFGQVISPFTHFHPDSDINSYLSNIGPHSSHMFNSSTPLTDLSQVIKFDSALQSIPIHSASDLVQLKCDLTEFANSDSVAISSLPYIEPRTDSTSVVGNNSLNELCVIHPSTHLSEYTLESEPRETNAHSRYMSGESVDSALTGSLPSGRLQSSTEDFASDFTVNSSHSLPINRSLLSPTSTYSASQNSPSHNIVSKDSTVLSNNCVGSNAGAYFSYMFPNSSTVIKSPDDILNSVSTINTISTGTDICSVSSSNATMYTESCPLNFMVPLDSQSNSFNNYNFVPVSTLSGNILNHGVGGIVLIGTMEQLHDTLNLLDWQTRNSSQNLNETHFKSINNSVPNALLSEQFYINSSLSTYGKNYSSNKILISQMNDNKVNAACSDVTINSNNNENIGGCNDKPTTISLDTSLRVDLIQPLCMPGYSVKPIIPIPHTQPS